ncbi:multiple monosaccharide ABC transporter substrate-binding protein [Streptomyces radicis]|uniref:Sugar ABC transporter substrate-binding protein n=1 Tax=Streptomyces radicis TaxID=1750517 RepID=A0A3A9WGX5_9ACTN|nr:multiple monosaccharide ABC transporter substrate-binding protein [Streptomyces radicis]RKN12049.1 sugar ABC transporter substrate-binding protein [Streptomyces radicis]RKN25900.1 sugar ABC transporter substrate-binding protein [Streptomyces radicis]
MSRARAATVRAAAAATVLALALAGCGQDSEGGSEDERDPGEEGGTIGIAMPTRSSERWIADGENMVAQFEEAGFDTDLQYGEDQIETQISQVENMIAQGVDLLVIAAIDGASLGNVLSQAADAEIPVVSYDRLLMDSEHVDCYATFDNERVGELQAQYIVDSLGLADGEEGPFNVELFAGSPDDNNTRYFFDGAIGVLQPYLDGGQLVARSGQTELNAVTTERWSGSEAQDRMDDLLTADYRGERIDAVLSPYDGISLGVIAALKSVGYGTEAQPLPVVTGQDAELASVQSIIAGEQTQTVYKDTRELARQAVAMGQALLNGEECEANDTETYDNGVKVVPSYLLEPVSIDAENHQLLVDEGYYTEADLAS